LRRFGTTHYGDQYASALAHYGEGNHEPPAPWDRHLVDFIDPLRAGSAVHLVNGVSHRTGQDTAAWPLYRLTSMARTLSQTAPNPDDYQTD
jgi:hypothetical protein